MPSPVISVIIPSYNHARFLSDAVNSVLRQTYKEIEVVIVDDCSSDGSQELIRTFDDPRLRHLLLDVNRGASAALNIGMELSIAPLIAICNSDDMWAENKLEMQVNFLRANPRVGAVYSNCWWIDERGKELSRTKVPHFDIFAQCNRSRFAWLRTLVETGNCFCHPSILIRREVYADCGLYDLRYRQLPDFDMWLRVLEKYNLFVMPEKTMLFRLLDNNKNTAAVTPDNSTRTINETSFILADFFERINAENFASAFGTIKTPGDKEFCLPIEKVLYLISAGGVYESIFKDIGHRLLFDFLKKTDALLDLHAYRLPFDLLARLMGLTSPWIDRQQLGPFNERELQFLKTMPQPIPVFTPAHSPRLDTQELVTTSRIAAEEQVRALNQEFIDLLNSESWKVTKRLRLYKSALVGLRTSAKGNGDLNGSVETPERQINNDSPIVSDFIERNEELTQPNYVIPLHQMDEPALLSTSAQLQSEIDAIKNSLSWRISRPIRVLKNSMSTIFYASPSLLSTAQKEEGSNSVETSEPVSQGPDLLGIYDDFFPCELSGFRYEEFCSILETIENSLVFTTGASLPAVGRKPEDIYSMVQNFNSANLSNPSNPSNFSLANRTRIFTESLAVKPKLAYCIFLSLADRYLSFFERHSIPFVFTMYPGGGLRMGEKECEDMIKKVCSSKQFRGLITTQRTVTNYLKENKLCKKDMITELVGAVVPRQFEQSAWSQKLLFGEHKQTVDICFVAHKYTEFGQDKGYDLFVQCALRQAEKFPHLRFHVVGGFDDSVLDVSAIRDRITFHGTIDSTQMQNLFNSMDIILSPNEGVVRGGEVDGFPTGCCMQAGVSGVLVFCTDEQKQNVLLKPDVDFVLINRSVDSICNAMEPFLRESGRIYKLAIKGRERFRTCFGWNSQMDTRIAYLKKTMAAL